MDTEHTSAVLLRALNGAYARTLKAFAGGASRIGPAVDSPEGGATGVALESRLKALGHEMGEATSPTDIDGTAGRIHQALEQWADAVEDDLRKKTADVKELLVTLAHTAASVAASDAEHVLRFDTLTARLRRIATLDDVGELRSAVLASATELCASVEAMSKSTRAVVMSMQAELTVYQAKLEAAEKLASHDPLTGLLNRRKIEAFIERRIEAGQPFTVGLIDLDDFKRTNDRLGHAAGDDLLQQFSQDLKSNTRPGDAVGRWGGDEFIVVSASAGGEAHERFTQIRQWVGGRYTLTGPQGTTKVDVQLSVGVAEWRPGMTAAALIDEADQMMYAAKRRAR